MTQFIKGLLGFSLRNRALIFIVTGIVAIYGTISFLQTPIEAFPDVTNTQIIIVTQWPGRSAEEIERFATVPIEIAMNSVQLKTNVRSVSMFGLSVVKIIFDDGVEDFFARQQVNNLLATVQLPTGAEADIQPPYGPTGEIFRYTLEAKNYTSSQLLELQNWVIDRQLRAVPGVADIVVFGGQEKIYDVQANPQLLSLYDLTTSDVYDVLSRSNTNVGGNVIEKNGQAFVVRGIGMLNSVKDIEDLVVKNLNGQPVYIRNVAQVVMGGMQRVGQAGRGTNNDVVEGIVVMRKGENPSKVLGAVKAKIADLNENVLPQGVKMVTFYDRDNLINFCTHTVLGNLTEGIILVTVVVFLFMADWRTTLIVSLIIPLALLFAFICLRLMGMSANLLSLGAVDFGIIIDGAVVMVEGLFVVLDQKAHSLGMERFNQLGKLRLVRDAGTRMAKNIFFAKLIIITALLPIFSFEKVEGKMFSPLAWTLGFALLGALIFTLTLVPVLVSILLKRNVREKHNPLVEGINRGVLRAYDWVQRRKALTMSLSGGVLLASLLTFSALGTEFLPQLNEGALWVTAQMPMSTSLSEATEMGARIRADIDKFDEVVEVMSQTGRSNDGTDPAGFYFNQFQVNLKPKKEWSRKISQEQLIDEIDAKLKEYPGIVYNYSQPVVDNVQEAVAGIKADNAVKIFGPNLEELEKQANQVISVLNTVPGVRDVGLLRNLGQPELRIVLDEQRMATYGVNVADAQSIIEVAIGGKTSTQLYEGERKFDVRLRLPRPFRSDEQQIGNIMVPSMNGTKVPLKQIADIGYHTGPAFVYRDNNQRFIGVKFTVRGRDLGSTIADAQASVESQVNLPKGYRIGWAGEFENMVRASDRLTQVVPVTILLIFFILFAAFGNMRDAGLVLSTLPFALIGGIFALLVTHTTFGISAGIGFIALFGICVQNGVILVSVWKQNLVSNKMTLKLAVRDGLATRIRPVVMTALMAAIGLLPAAISTGIGSETQRPLARVVIGGLISATILTLLVFPVLFQWAYRKQRIIE